MSGFRIDIWISPELKFDEDKFQRRRKIEIDKYPVYFVSPEDLILNKLWRYRTRKLPKDIDDIRSILSGQKDKLDYAFLDEMSAVLRAKRLLTALKKEIE